MISNSETSSNLIRNKSWIRSRRRSGFIILYEYEDCHPLSFWCCQYGCNMCQRDLDLWCFCCFPDEVPRAPSLPKHRYMHGGVFFFSFLGDPPNSWLSLWFPLTPQNKHCPTSIHVAGSVFPADGAARLEPGAGGARRTGAAGDAGDAVAGQSAGGGEGGGSWLLLAFFSSSFLLVVV